MSLLDGIGLRKLKDGLTKTRSQLVDRVTRLVVAKGSIDDELLEQLDELLLASDVGAGAAAAIIEDVKRHVKEQRYMHSTELNRLLKEAVRQQFSQALGQPEPQAGEPDPRKPYVILVVGVNGVGKTTTIGKLAHRYVVDGKSVLIAAADTFRAAAHEQLEIWAKRAGAQMIHQRHGADPAAVAFDALQAAMARKADVVIVDTAGRLHTKTNLMEELKKISRVMKKLDDSAPHEVLLVIDASTGQNGLQQARQFASASGVTGLVLTKLDGTAKGGIILAILRELKIPVRYVGLGEHIEDLQPFDDEAFVDALFEQEPT